MEGRKGRLGNVVASPCHSRANQYLRHLLRKPQAPIVRISRLEEARPFDPRALDGRTDLLRAAFVVIRHVLPFKVLVGVDQFVLDSDACLRDRSNALVGDPHLTAVFRLVHDRFSQAIEFCLPVISELLSDWRFICREVFGQLIAA